MLYPLHGLTFLVIEVAWVQLRILLMGIQNGVYQLENHLGVLKTLGIKFQMPLKALLMLDIQNMKVSKAIYIFFGAGTAKWIWDSSIFSSIKPKLDMGLFVDFCVFTCFYQFLHDVLIKLLCFDLQNNFMITSCKNW